MSAPPAAPPLSAAQPPPPPAPGGAPPKMRLAPGAADAASPLASASASALAGSPASAPSVALSASHPRSLQPLSDRARSKRPLVGPALSLDELRGDMLHETDGLIPLRDMVVRMANFAYESFLNMGETMGSLSGDQRRKKIFDTVLDVRRQLAKLLVIVIWASKANAALQTRDLIGLVNEQFGQANQAIQDLIAVRKSLPGARVRHYDLLSAIDVLSTGTYHLAPASVTGLPLDADELSDKEQLAIIDALSSAVRLRLACGEDLPSELARYSVQDGKATLRAEGLFTAEVTLSGNEPQDRWYLLNIEFHLTVTGAGAARFPSKPNEIQKAHILAQADAVLAAPPPPDPEPGTETGEEPLLPPPTDRKALQRLFIYLRQAALTYQLEILHYQALHLASREWGSNLQVRWTPGTSLEMTYWCKQRAEARKGATEPPPPNCLSPGTITITLPPSDGQATDELLAPPLRSHLSAHWSAPGLGVTQSKAIQPDALDLETTLRHTTGEHAQRALEHLVLPCQGTTPHVDGSHRRQVAKLALPAGLALELSLSTVSGALTAAVVPAGAGGDHVLLSLSQGPYGALLAPLGARLREDPSQMLPSWQAVALEVLLQDLEQRITFAGLPVVRTLPLSEAALMQLDPTLQASYVFVPVRAGAYLVVGATMHATRVGLMETLKPADGSGPLLLQTIHWLDRARLASQVAPASWSPDVALSTEEIRWLHDYALVVASCASIQQQLALYHTTATLVHTRPLALENDKNQKEGTEWEALVPSMSIQAAPLLGELAAWVRPNLFARVQGEGICFALCWTYDVGLPEDSMRSPEGLDVSFDHATKVMRIYSAKVEEAVEQVRQLSLRLLRVVILARAVLSLQGKKEAVPHLALRETRLDLVRFVYADRALATVRWAKAESGWEYRLDVERLPHPAYPTRKPERNPHEWTRYFLEAYLNAPGNKHVVHWIRFLRLLRDTFPVLDALQGLQAAHTTPPDNVPRFDLDAMGVAHVLVTFGGGSGLDMRLISQSRLLMTDSVRCSPYASQYPCLGYSMLAAYNPLPGFAAVLERATKRARAQLPPSKLTRVVNLRQGLMCAADDRTARTVVREVVQGIIAQGLGLGLGEGLEHGAEAQPEAQPGTGTQGKGT